jgi:transposase-like protein
VGWMRVIEAVSRREKRWAELIREHGKSKLSVSAFCREHGVSDQSFYNWRKRLAGSEPVRFALVEANAPVTKDSLAVEVILASGDRLRVAPGTDGATLRTVLSVLRELCA